MKFVEIDINKDAAKKIIKWASAVAWCGLDPCLKKDLENLRKVLDENGITGIISNDELDRLKIE